ncbi:MAG: signal peptidase I [Oscillospiraceae bacterium]|nr:signal peptidase I [Oscillospiraceae bacterium]
METLKKIMNGVCTALFALLLILTVLLTVGRFTGFHVFTVLSGSMEPTYPTGSLICVRPVETAELETGDIITYLVSDNTLVTHRIAGVVPDGQDPSVLRFRTKGDANETEDMLLVHQNNVVGTPFFCIPGVGYVVEYIRRPPGIFAAVAGLSLLALLMFLPDLFAKEDEDEEEEEETAPAGESEQPAE